MSYAHGYGLGQGSIWDEVRQATLTTAESFPVIGPMAIAYDAYSAMNAPPPAPVVPQVAAPTPETAIALPSPGGTGIGPLIPTVPQIDIATGQAVLVPTQPVPQPTGHISGSTALVLFAVIFGGALALGSRRR